MNYKRRMDIKMTGKEKLLKMLKTMLLIRHFEFAVEQLTRHGKIPCACHLSIGQEASAVGVCSAISENDYVFSIFNNFSLSISIFLPLYIFISYI